MPALEKNDNDESVYTFDIFFSSASLLFVSEYAHARPCIVFRQTIELHSTFEPSDGKHLAIFELEYADIIHLLRDRQ